MSIEQITADTEELNEKSVDVNDRKSEETPAEAKNNNAAKAPDTEIGEQVKEDGAQKEETDSDEEIPEIPDNRNYVFYDERVAPNGNHTGEDAIPFASDSLLIVADGLGGAGGFVHKNVNDLLFDPNKLDDIFHFNGDKESLAYAKHMFSEFYRPQTPVNGNDFPYPTLPKLPLKEYKKSDAERIAFFKGIKKSGYYGSHLVAVLMKKYFTAEKIAECFKTVNGAPDTDAETDKLGKEFTSYIRDEMNRIHNEADLNKDALPTNQHIYLPTTLASALVNEPEGESYTELILFYAGDSRVYCFTEANGFQQVTADDESEQTALMTNKITISDENFYINCRYVRIPKPCAIFAASDGLFDMMGENIDFEFYMLSILKSASSFEEYGRILSENYFRVARPDDSCSIALHLSETDFDQIKKVGEKKLNQLLAEYQDDEKDGVKYIFTENYTDGYRSIEDHIDIMFRRACNDESIYAGFRKKAEETYADTGEKVEQVKAQVKREREEKEADLAKKKSSISDIYRKYWSFDDSYYRLRHELLETISELKDKRARLLNGVWEHLSSIPDEIRNSLNSLDALTEKFNAEIRKIKNFEALTLSEDTEKEVKAISREINDELENMRKELRKLFETKRSSILPFIKGDSQLTKLNKEITERENEIEGDLKDRFDAMIASSESAAEEKPEKFLAALNSLIASNNISELLSNVPSELCDDDLNNIREAISMYHQAEDELKAFIEENENITKRVIDECIEEHSRELMMMYIEGNKAFLAGYISENAKLANVLKRYPQWAQGNDSISPEERFIDIVNNYHKRQKLYEKYDSTYNALIKPRQEENK
ncbi:MAG: hypothetical protein IKB34_00375 [Clostridia bacterium]|nr:hypothetical protein [Clostridia bacterium]